MGGWVGLDEGSEQGAAQVVVGFSGEAVGNAGCAVVCGLHVEGCARGI